VYYLQQNHGGKGILSELSLPRIHFWGKMRQNVDHMEERQAANEEAVRAMRNADRVSASRHKRCRATAVVIEGGKVLLVRDNGKHDFSLPGGGFKRGESTQRAAAREVFEELRLKTISSTRLRELDFVGRRASHKVALLVTTGRVHLDRGELDRYLWWDTKEELDVQGHVQRIVSGLRKLELL